LPAMLLPSRCGRLDDLVLSLSGVLPDGARFRSQDSPRSAAGPDLDRLLIGSRDPLAIITGAVLSIHPLPAWSETQCRLFPDLPTGIEALRRIMRADLNPASACLQDELPAEIRDKLPRDPGPGCLLVISFEGPASPLARAKARKGFSLCGERSRQLDPALTVKQLQEEVLTRLTAFQAAGRGPAVGFDELLISWSRMVPLHRELQALARPFFYLSTTVKRPTPQGAVLELAMIAASTEALERQDVISASRGVAEAYFRAALASPLRPAGKSAAEIFRRYRRRLDPVGFLAAGWSAPSTPAKEKGTCN